MLNKTILHMAASYLELDMSGCLENVLGLDENFRILDWLFDSESNETSGHMPVYKNPQFFSLEEIFSVTVDSVDKSIQLLPGRFGLFLNILKGASNLDDDIRLGMARWLLGALVDESLCCNVQ
ncbi:hypothetical protein LIER_30869 [Lithospermum erythrorhizon]|uniref:Uncharacterized protein n=1 Tax=Lithospermum erythrorhizon TaxID=34254 RepID=A0AAV3RST1_LITER